jgi:hypothetical protein
MRVILKVRPRGKHGYDISSVPVKKLEKMNECYNKRWVLKETWLILEAH